MNIAQAISEVAKKVGPIYKDRSAQGYSYRGIEDMMNALSLPLREVGVVIVPHVDVVEHHDEPQGKKPGWVRVVLQVTYTIYGPEGDSITARVSADALDNSDKGHGKALSYCYKTLVGQLFCIPTEEDNEQFNSDDHDGERGLDPKVVAKLDDARAEFKLLTAEDKSAVTDTFTDEFGVGLKEIETLKQATGLAKIIAAQLEPEETNELDELRELIDGLAKDELPEWAKFCAAEDMKAGEPESWSTGQIESAFNWLETEDN